MTLDIAVSFYAGLLVGSRIYPLDLEDEEGNLIRATTFALYIPFVVLNITNYKEIEMQE